MPISFFVYFCWCLNKTRLFFRNAMMSRMLQWMDRPIEYFNVWSKSLVKLEKYLKINLKRWDVDEKPNKKKTEEEEEKKKGVCLPKIFSIKTYNSELISIALASQTRSSFTMRNDTNIVTFALIIILMIRQRIKNTHQYQSISLFDSLPLKKTTTTTTSEK